MGSAPAPHCQYRELQNTPLDTGKHLSKIHTHLLCIEGKTYSCLPWPASDAAPTKPSGKCEDRKWGHLCLEKHKLLPHIPTGLSTEEAAFLLRHGHWLVGQLGFPSEHRAEQHGMWSCSPQSRWCSRERKEHTGKQEFNYMKGHHRSRVVSHGWRTVLGEEGPGGVTQSGL